MPENHLLKQLEQLVPSTADNIFNRFFQHTTAQLKADGSIVTEADLAIQEALRSELKKIAPDIAMLGEEMGKEQQLDVINNHKSYWCLDPVDGTNNFHHGVPLFATSLALIENKQLSIGLIYDPVRKETFAASRGSGLRINGNSVTRQEQPEALSRCLASVDFKRLKPEMRLRLCQKMPFKSQRNIGTCALEWAWLAAGRTQLLLHGGEKFWDYAAGSLLLAEAGGFSSTETHDPVFNNSLDDRPVIAASNSELHKAWLEFLVD